MHVVLMTFFVNVLQAPWEQPRQSAVWSKRCPVLLPSVWESCWHEMVCLPFDNILADALPTMNNEQLHVKGSTHWRLHAIGSIVVPFHIAHCIIWTYCIWYIFISVYIYFIAFIIYIVVSYSYRILLIFLISCSLDANYAGPILYMASTNGQKVLLVKINYSGVCNIHAKVHFVKIVIFFIFLRNFGTCSLLSHI